MNPVFSESGLFKLVLVDSSHLISVEAFVFKIESSRYLDL